MNSSRESTVSPLSALLAPTGPVAVTNNLLPAAPELPAERAVASASVAMHRTAPGWPLPAEVNFVRVPNGGSLETVEKYLLASPFPHVLNWFQQLHIPLDVEENDHEYGRPFRNSTP